MQTLTRKALWGAEEEEEGGEEEGGGAASRRRYSIYLLKLVAGDTQFTGTTVHILTQLLPETARRRR